MIFWARELVICNSVIDIIRNRKYFTQISPKAFWPPQFTVNLAVIETSTKNNYNKCQKERKEERWKSMVTWQVYLKSKFHRYHVLTLFQYTFFLFKYLKKTNTSQQIHCVAIKTKSKNLYSFVFRTTSWMSVSHVKGGPHVPGFGLSALWKNHIS